MTDCTTQRISRELKRLCANLKLRLAGEIAHLRPQTSLSQRIFISGPDLTTSWPRITKSGFFTIATIGRNKIEIFTSFRVLSPAQITGNGENFCFDFCEMTGTMPGPRIYIIRGRRMMAAPDRQRLQ